MDVHGESSVTWEDVSNYFIEQGMSGEVRASPGRAIPDAPGQRFSSSFLISQGFQPTINRRVIPNQLRILHYRSLGICFLERDGAVEGILQNPQSKTRVS